MVPVGVGAAGPGGGDQAADVLTERVVQEYLLADSGP